MKRILTLIILAITLTMSAGAQEVYTEIMRLSKKVADDKTKSLEIRKVGTFKVDALTYMAGKALELTPDSSATVLDRQAYAMYDYVNLFVKKYGEAKSNSDKAKIVDIFKTASLQNPRFNDTDRELIDSYINAEGYITKFSLDTDWEKAANDVRTTLRSKGL